MRVVIDRLGDRYGNSMGEREDEIERERERKERKRTEVESCFLSRQIEFLRGGFASTFPSFHEERENWGALATVKTETRFRESFSSLSLSLSLESISRRWIPRASTSIALIVERKVDEAREMARLAPFHALNTNDRRSNSFHDFEINRLSWRDKYNGVNSISSLRFDCHCEIALLLQWNFAINEYREYSGIKFR